MPSHSQTADFSNSPNQKLRTSDRADGSDRARCGHREIQNARPIEASPRLYQRPLLEIGVGRVPSYFALTRVARNQNVFDSRTGMVLF
jgi:hypothetical protein